MSFPYHRNYALNEQRGHQLFYDQVLETYPIPVSSDEFAPGVYQADGSVASWGKNCSIKITDQYNMPTCCSTWASGRQSQPICCPCPTPLVQAVVPPVFFPVSAQDEMNVAMNRQ
jgi:hypothetical protein